MRAESDLTRVLVFVTRDGALLGKGLVALIASVDCLIAPGNVGPTNAAVSRIGSGNSDGGCSCVSLLFLGCRWLRRHR